MILTILVWESSFNFQLPNLRGLVPVLGNLDKVALRIKLQGNVRWIHHPEINDWIEHDRTVIWTIQQFVLANCLLLVQKKKTKNIWHPRIVPTGGKQPPLTATGVAPWAFKAGQKTNQSSSTFSCYLPCSWLERIQLDDFWIAAWEVPVSYNTH